MCCNLFGNLKTLIIQHCVHCNIDSYYFNCFVHTIIYSYYMYCVVQLDNENVVSTRTE